MLNKIVCSLVMTAGLTAICVARGASQPQNDGAQAPHPSMVFTPGTLIRAELDKTIDAKKAKVGDQV
jgi:hypothetical protein